MPAVGVVVLWVTFRQKYLARWPLRRALLHPEAATGAAELAVEPVKDQLPFGGGLAQAVAEPPPWRAHRGAGRVG